mmetsp:Transcript_31340/g.86153  ORF Transcript_31340/g.86153 Transcript_31340/m.86153 type:complete len:270 (+) Transcript_31340:2596-3405(+)
MALFHKYMVVGRGPERLWFQLFPRIHEGHLRAPQLPKSALSHHAALILHRGSVAAASETLERCPPERAGQYEECGFPWRGRLEASEHVVVEVHSMEQMSAALLFPVVAHRRLFSLRENSPIGQILVVFNDVVQVRMSLAPHVLQRHATWYSNAFAVNRSEGCVGITPTEVFVVVRHYDLDPRLRDVAGSDVGEQLEVTWRLHRHHIAAVRVVAALPMPPRYQADEHAIRHLASNSGPHFGWEDHDVGFGRHPLVTTPRDKVAVAFPERR